MKPKFFITVLFIFLLSGFVTAQTRSADQSQQTPVPPGRGVYVDANNNGVCDYYEQPGVVPGYGRRMVNARGGGYGRGYAAGYGGGRGAGMGYGRALPAGQGRGLGPAKGWGRGLGPGQGRGAAPGGRYFVDENKNGVCDVYEQSNPK